MSAERRRPGARVGARREEPRQVVRDVAALVGALAQAPPRARALRSVFEAWLDAGDEEHVTLVSADGAVMSVRPGSSPGTLSAPPLRPPSSPGTLSAPPLRPPSSPGTLSAAAPEPSSSTLDEPAWVAAAVASLSSAGPRSYAGYERVFRDHLLGLDLRLGALDPPTRAARAAELAPARAVFADALAAYHRNAAPAWASGGRRPMLVCDAAERAAELASERQARGSHLLWIDSLRADAWERLRASLVSGAPAGVSVLDEWLHWTAPEGSARAQVDVFARGPVALVSRSKDGRDPPAAESSVETAAQPRRVWLGRQEVAWVDAYAVARASWNGNLAGLYELVEKALLPALRRWLASLPAASVVAVVGDRGFRDLGPGHGVRYVDGGGTPEEVLAPAALLWTEPR